MCKKEKEALIACEELDRKCYMMEYDPVYADVIIARWEEYTGKKAEKIREEENNDDTFYC